MSGGQDSPAAEYEAAERRAADAQERLQSLRTAAAQRAAQFAGITAESHIEAAQIRALADRVRLEDPAAIEAAAIEAAQAHLTATLARYEALEAEAPPLQAEVDRLEALTQETTKAWNAARMALSHTQPMFNGKGAEIGEAHRQLTAAREAARKGAEERLATLTGTSPTPPPMRGANILGTHHLHRVGARHGVNVTPWLPNAGT